MGIISSLLKLFGKKSDAEEVKTEIHSDDELVVLESHNEADGTVWNLVSRGQSEEQLGATLPGGDVLIPAIFERVMYINHWHMFVCGVTNSEGKICWSISESNGHEIVPVTAEFEEIWPVMEDGKVAYFEGNTYGTKAKIDLQGHMIAS
jgi:hypothetical protein